jgi:hypothetical protein
MLGTKKIEDSRTFCNALIFGSRILREVALDHQVAKGTAAGALVEAAKAKLEHAVRITQCAASIAAKDEMMMQFSRIDSWIGCGEAYFYCQDYNKALEYFDRVASDARARTNPKVVAVSELMRARCNALLGNGTVAREILLNWEGYGRPGNENAYIRTLEAALQEDFKNPSPSTLWLKPGVTLDPLNWDRLEFWRQEVFQWFAVEAMRLVKKNDTTKTERELEKEAAVRLEMDPQTLRKWRDKKWGKKPNTSAAAASKS